jgi:hypothetical protein
MSVLTFVVTELLKYFGCHLFHISFDLEIIVSLGGINDPNVDITFYTIIFLACVPLFCRLTNKLHNDPSVESAISSYALAS